MVFYGVLWCFMVFYVHWNLQKIWYFWTELNFLTRKPFQTLSIGRSCLSSFEFWWQLPTQLNHGVDCDTCRWIISHAVLVRVSVSDYRKQQQLERSEIELAESYPGCLCSPEPLEAVETQKHNLPISVSTSGFQPTSVRWGGQKQTNDWMNSSTSINFDPSY